MPNYVGLDDLKPVTAPGRGPAHGPVSGHHPSAQDFGRNYLSAYPPARSSPQRFDVLQQPGDTNDRSPRIVESQ